MRQRRFQVWDSGQEDGIALVMVVALEDEFVPVVRVRAAFQEPMQSLFVRAETRLRQAPLEKLQPVILARHQDVRGREGDVITGKVGQQWRQESDVPEFAGSSSIARGVVADELGVGDEFTQADVWAVRADVFVDAHSGSGQLL